MKCVLFLFSCVIALTLASHHGHDECGLLQRYKIKAQWAEVYGTGNKRLEFGRNVYKKFFFLEPESKKLFTRVLGEDIFSAEFQAHTTRVFGAIDMVVGQLDDQSTFQALLDHLREQHSTIGLNKEYLRSFGRALGSVASTYVVAHHDHFDTAAWRSCFKVIFSGIWSPPEKEEQEVVEEEKVEDAMNAVSADEAVEDNHEDVEEVEESDQVVEEEEKEEVETTAASVEEMEHEEKEVEMDLTEEKDSEEQKVDAENESEAKVEIIIGEVSMPTET